jgi:hypothetical protein
MTSTLRRRIRVERDLRVRARLAEVSFCRACDMPHEYGQLCDLCESRRLHRKATRTVARPV